jgi:nucleoside-diphosphate-sugar epimerase
MKTLIAGANGKVGRHIVAMLGKRAVAMVRADSQAEHHRQLGADVLVHDLEDDLTATVNGCDTVIFTAGSGGKTGADKTILIDLDAAVRLVQAARAASVRRFVMVSSIGAEDPAKGPEPMRHYLVAKMIADRELKLSGLDFTIVRPGRLTDEKGTGKVRVGADIGYGSITREDTAATVVACLDAPHTIGQTFCVLNGDTPVSDALSNL